MRRRAAVPPAPLPQRRGVDPVRRRLPFDGGWATVRDYLVDRLPVPPALVDAMFAEGAVHGEAGVLPAGAPYLPGAYVWYHRELEPEVPVPFPVTVLHRDERIVVADKPHFLAVTPRGRHVVETALSRLRNELALPELSPAHRLDRLTAGLTLFVARPEYRGAYQALFAERRFRKEYRAVAPFDPELSLPRTVRSHLVKERGELTAREVPGPPNSSSVVELLTHRAGLGGYRLLPETGKTHQLRVHLSALGIPILHDPLYPEVLAEAAPDDFRRPLQLLAHTLEFTDPVTGAPMRFESARRLSAWPSEG
ncbi:RluA family pseudouridine synthase [Kitasatospora sp. CMC57]|uniref:RNA pseudouridylate synthase n=1 Tax=Kitasatospora sp. CMC57 TaxID=3231513 RepID=A0AB33JTH1_9ACTN